MSRNCAARLSIARFIKAVDRARFSMDKCLDSASTSGVDRDGLETPLKGYHLGGSWAEAKIGPQMRDGKVFLLWAIM